MLRIEFVNDRTGPDNAANYEVRVTVNGRIIDELFVTGHDRSWDWGHLVDNMLRTRVASGCRCD